ncbi:hypothetical protein Raf01_09280 [Rugosimonospora africana]|uniref:Uncharacterized protein n=1 Tax=Rugosimonospora africana TaxID=556532 RepID=A0A8J3QPG6_9ACTN|nr:hypothetical protein Raf01_09280 [Rugosimonospora africana]
MRRQPRVGVAYAPESSTHLPRGSGLFNGEHGFAFAAAGAVFYRTKGHRYKWPNGDCGKMGWPIAPESLKRA